MAMPSIGGTGKLVEMAAATLCYLVSCWTHVPLLRLSHGVSPVRAIYLFSHFLQIRSMNNPNDLLLALKEGKEAAYQQLFHQLYIPLYQYATNFLPEPTAAEECVQEVFIYLWEKRQQIHIQTSLQAYLYRAVRHKALDWLKSKNYRMQQQTASLEKPNGEDGITFEIADPDSPYDGITEAELAKLIGDAIAQLPEKCREVFLLSREEGLSYREIADTMHISIKTVENQMGQALKKIRAFLGKHWEMFLMIYFIKNEKAIPLSVIGSLFEQDIPVHLFL